MTVQSLSDIFFANWKKFGENYATIHNDGERVKKSTYKQLSFECYKVTQCLREVRALGFIGIFMEQDLALPALILGILGSDLPFSCIDIQDSQERVLGCLNYLSIKWVFTKRNCFQVNEVLKKCGTKVNTLLLYEDDYVLWHINVNFLTESKFLHVPSTYKLAYAIQTSGSTGKPKVILVPHQCILPNVLDISQLLQVDQNDLIFLASPLTFDPSIIEIFIPFTCGAALLIVPSSIRATPSVLLNVLFPFDSNTYSGINILQITPSVFSRWSISDIQTRILNRTTTLKKLLFGGEPCPSIALLKSWKSIDNKTEIFNMYGITEVSCWATAHPINLYTNVKPSGHEHTCEKSISSVPLGSSFSKTLLQVRNVEGNQIFNGEGELFIGSSERICLVDEEGLTQLPIPLFRATGDIVKVDKCCNSIMFVGRKNRIIKRWGHRVCLNSVETILSNHEDVETCACLWDQERNILTVAVVWKIENRQSFRLYCLCHLYKAEVPEKVVSVKTLPLTNHGKVDYEELKYTILHNDDQTNLCDEVSLSAQILCAWKNVLGQEPLLSGNFMSSGGNSFLAIQLTAELEQIFGEGVRSKVMTMLFDNSSVSNIMSYLLGNNLRNETQIDDSIISGNTSTLEKMIFCNNSENKQIIHFGEQNNDTTHSLSEKNFKDDVTPSARKRKLHYDVTEISKLEKTDLCAGTSTSKEEENNFSSIPNEDPLVEVRCRGTINQRETLVDSSVLKYGEVVFHLNWKHDMHKCVDASPCYLKFAKKSWVAVGSHSHLLVVLECSSGKIVSKCELPDRIESSICPSFCGKYGIVGCYDGCVYCISLQDGRIKWTFRTEAMVKSTPALCLRNTGVVVGSYDKNLYCISVENGKLIWKNSPSTAGIYASPCVSNNNMVYVGTLNGTCVSLCERTGQLVWKTQVASPVFSSPTLVHSFKYIIFSEVVGIVHCFSADNGDKIWQFKVTGEIFSSISYLYHSGKLYELFVFGSHDRHLYCLKWNHNDNEPTLNWKQRIDSSIYATPFIYKVQSVEMSACSHSQTIFPLVIVASTKGILYVLNGENGSIKSSKTLTHEVFSSPIFCEGHFIVGCRDNYLYNFTLLPKR